MRQGEILSLRWEYVDLHLGIAHLPLTKNGTARDVPLSMESKAGFEGVCGAGDGPGF